MDKQSGAEVTDRYRATLVGYLSNPDNPFPKRKDYPKIIERSKDCLYKHFTPDDLLDIESEAYDNRKKQCTAQRSDVLEALLKRAKGYTCYEVHVSTYKGDVTETTIPKHIPPDRAAAQEFLDRIEGKVANKTDIDLTVKDRKFELTFSKYRKKENEKD